MQALDLLLNRASVAPRLHAEPAPSDSELNQILAAACRAPDHGRLRPWRFIVIRGDARAKLGEVFADALKKRDPNAPQATLDKELNRPLRSPLIVAVIATAQKDHPKIPEVEQIVSAGAAAHAMVLAAQAMGYGGMLLTGTNAYDETVKAALGVAPSETIISYAYFGTPTAPMPDAPRPKPADITQEWTGPAA